MDFSILIAQQHDILKQIDALLQEDFPKIIIDLSAVHNIPSTAMGLCMAAARKAKDLGKHLTIKVKRKHSGAIGLTGLHQFADIVLS